MQDVDRIRKQQQAGLVILVLLLILGFLGIRSCSSATPASDPAKVSLAPYLGSERTLSLPNGGSPVFVASDEEAYNALVKACAALDQDGVLDLMAAGKVLNVAGPVKVRILDVKFGKVQIRVLEGPDAGLSGWVAGEDVS